MRSLAVLPTALLVLLTSTFASALDAAEFPGFNINYTNPITCSRPSKVGDKIAVHYKGTLQSTGAEFDESYRRGAPFTFTLGAGHVIKGWDLGLLDMCPGAKRTLTIPPELGYGNRGTGPIPGGATLVFETEMVDIVGIKQETLTLAPTSAAATAATTTEEGAFGIATAPATPSAQQDEDVTSGLTATPLDPEKTAPASPTQAEEGQAECHLLGPFALLVQAALGAVAVLSLVWKRYHETPKRPWKIFFFDVSKQVFGSMLTHVLNLAMSMLSSVDLVNVAAMAGAEGAKNDPEGRVPNPCSYYLLNLGIDTTIGIPVLYVLLKVLHSVALHTPLANPPQSIKSGHYGQPPKATWWLKQSMIYFLGLVGMKLFVFFLFAAMPWLPWVGDWALRWTKGNEALEITFAMFIFPLGMNAIQYWIIDSFIMEKQKGGKGKDGYEQVQGEEEADERGGEDDGSVTEVEPDVLGKAQVEDSALAEVNPTPIPVDRLRGEGSGDASPVDEEGAHRR